jgi:RNA polymerase sigma factor (TIGR02999 family)
VDAPTPQPSQITNWLGAWAGGDAAAGARIIDALYPELKRIAARFLGNERTGHTLDPQALLHEGWLRLAASDPIAYHNRAHFLALAAQTMRRVLIDHARTRHREKRGGHQQQLSLTAIEGWNPVAYDEDLLDLDKALDDLARADSRAARVVELRFFGGLLEEDIAGALGVSIITVKRDWKVARVWLMHRISGKAIKPPL